MNYTKKQIRENRFEVAMFIISTIAVLILFPQYITSNGIENIMKFAELVLAVGIQITTLVNIAAKLEII